MCGAILLSSPAARLSCRVILLSCPAEGLSRGDILTAVDSSICAGKGNSWLFVILALLVDVAILMNIWYARK